METPTNMINTLWWEVLDPISKTLDAIDILNLSDKDYTRDDLHRTMTLLVRGAYVTTRQMKDNNKLSMFLTGEKIEDEYKKDFPW